MIDIRHPEVHHRTVLVVCPEGGCAAGRSNARNATTQNKTPSPERPGSEWDHGS